MSSNLINGESKGNELFKGNKFGKMTKLEFKFKSINITTRMRLLSGSYKRKLWSMLKESLNSSIKSCQFSRKLMKDPI